ncbi:MAG: M20 family metallo-hydrolase [Bacillota bacterium]
MSSKKRIKKRIEKFAKFTESDSKYTRFSYTKQDIQAKKYLINEMKNLGLNVYMDYIGNIFGRKEGRKKGLPEILIGSHLDTVRNGGKYDGVSGIVTGLEVIKSMNNNNIEIDHPIEVVAFAEEEGGTYSTAFLGSQWYADKFTDENLDKFNDNNGKNIKEAIKTLDVLDQDVIRCKKKEKNLKCMFELHCEQGPVLEMNGKELGIVEGITGSSSFKVEIIGDTNHAGTTPMNARKDPFYLASLISVELNSFVRKQNVYSVATIGNIQLEPNVYNIIPRKASFTMDIRSFNIKTMEGIIEHIKGFIKDITKEKSMKYKIIKNHLKYPVELSENLVNNLEESCLEKNYNYQRIVSGAGHDSIIMNELCDTVMIFVPSKNGKSHCPEEFSKVEDIAKGVNIILDTIQKI